MRPSIPPASRATAVLFLLGTTLLAQTGPWTDGELIVRNGSTLYRVAPETGDAEALVSFGYWGGWAGSMVFDSYRGGLLINASLPPDSTFLYKLWVVSHDGSAVSIPGFTGASLRAMASTGDGRVYYQEHGDPLSHIKYLDAANAVHTLMDATGTAPLQFSVEHLLFHAPSNSLFATNSAWWSPNDCVLNLGSVFRIPLSADGSQVAGSIACTDAGSGYADLMAMDHLPGGDLLLTLSVGAFTGEPKLLRVNPWTLAVTTWGQPQQLDLEGGCYSVRAGGTAVALCSDGIRKFPAGSSATLGALLVTDVPLASGGGYSPVESLIEIDVNGPGCVGIALPFGTGVAGAGGFVPTLGVAGCPDVGSFFTISLDHALPAAPGALAVSPAPATIPIAGGTLYVDPVIALLLPIVIAGAPADLPGTGSFGLPILFADPAFAGLTLYLQAAVLDPAAVQGVALTNGLLLSIG